jgi:hypothetical protein
MVLENIHIKVKGIIQTNKGIFSWDIYGSNLRINRIGWIKILDYFLNFPNEAFNVKQNNNCFSFGHSYSYVLLEKEYLNEFKDVITSFIKSILEDNSNFESNEDLKTEINVWEVFKVQYNLMKEKYSCWHSKKSKICLEKKEYNRFRILQRDGFKCKICGACPPEVTLHIDHWFPKARGGEDKYENLITLCCKCNLSKHAQVPINKIEDML